MSGIHLTLGACLAHSLVGQGRYAEAEPLVVSGYDGMKSRTAARDDAEDHWLREAADRVVNLYLCWNKPGKLAE